MLLLRYYGHQFSLQLLHTNHKQHESCLSVISRKCQKGNLIASSLLRYFDVLTEFAANSPCLRHTLNSFCKMLSMWYNRLNCFTAEL